MFDKDLYQNQILPFFNSENNLEHKTFDYVRFVSSDGYGFYVVGSLSSHNISNLNDYLKLGLEDVKSRIEKNQRGEILDRMKSAIFESGDHLASELVNENLPVEDVDFSVSVLAVKDGFLYVWNDGELNLRIYRSGQSILLNQSDENQFFGSTEIELGDIISVSYSDYLVEHDEFYEDYVLEKAKISYPALYIDYQIDNDEIHTSVFELEDSVSAVEKDSQIQEPEIETEYFNEKDTSESDFDRSNEEPVLERNYSTTDFASSSNKANDIKSKLLNVKDKTISQLKRVQSSGVGKQIVEKLKIVGSYIHNFALKISSIAIDFFYTVILRKNSHQLKRFQGSYKKKNLQYLLIFVFIMLGVYLLFFRGSGESVKKDNKNNNEVVNTQDFKKDIDAEFAKLTQFYNTKQIPSFNDSFTKVQDLIGKAKSANFSDQSYLDAKSNEALKYQDVILKVTSISKIDEVYFSANINNAKIVDFAVVGTDVYALDKQNGQVLKSSSNQQFEVFAGDERLKNLSQIICLLENCYVIDEEKGIANLDLSTKKFEIYPGLSEDAKGVKEMIYFSGRIYTFIPSKNQVLRYDSVGESGLSQPLIWNTDAGFGVNTTDIAVDGNVFEFTKTEGLRKYYAGALDSAFEGLQAANPVLGKNVQFVMPVARDSSAGIKERVYIADSDNNRVAVYDKTLAENETKYKFLGSYKYRGSSQIKFDNFEEVFLSDDEKSIYILENNSVYKIPVTEI